MRRTPATRLVIEAEFLRTAGSLAANPDWIGRLGITHASDNKTLDAIFRLWALAGCRRHVLNIGYAEIRQASRYAETRVDPVEMFMDDWAQADAFDESPLKPPENATAMETCMMAWCALLAKKPKHFRDVKPWEHPEWPLVGRDIREKCRRVVEHARNPLPLKLKLTSVVED